MAKLSKRQKTYGLILVGLIMITSAGLILKPTKHKTARLKANPGCSTTSKTVSGPATVTLTLHVKRCYIAGTFQTSSGSYDYTKGNGASYFYAQMNTPHDTIDKKALYNSSVSYSYKTTDGPVGSKILILNANVDEVTGELQFNQLDGG